MSSLLSDLVPALQRSIAVPGGFDDLFPDAIEQDLIGLLTDAIAGAQLDRFLLEFEVDPDASTVTPDLSNGEALNADGALVILYASYQLLVNEIRNRRTHVRYQAGTAIFEEDQTAALLNELLRQAKARIDELKLARDRGDLSSSTHFFDLNFIRSSTDYGRVGVLPLTAWGY